MGTNSLSPRGGDAPQSPMRILAIETTCDETAAAVVEDGRRVLSSVVHSQLEEHRRYGGVVPEIASRRHVEAIVPVTQEALTLAGLPLAGVDGIAVSAAPGLIGAVLVGVNFAKGLALAGGQPLIPVHHIRGHVAANYITHPGLTPPFLCLIVSGGHSHIVKVEDYTSFQVLGRTWDDAAGEAFDKTARSLGLPYPGGVELDKISRQGNPDRYRLPNPQAEGKYNFSFSGLKTAVINLVHNGQQKGEPVDTQDMAAAICRQIADILWERLSAAARDFGQQKIVLAGGVAANSWLRQKAEAGCRAAGWQLFMPTLDLCGDNAAMIGAQGYYQYRAGYVSGMGLNGRPTMDVAAEF